MRGNSQVSRCQSPSMGFTLGYLGWLSILFAFVALRCVGVHAETVEKQSELGPVSAMVRVDPAEPLVGDPVTLTLTVIAEQGVDVLMPEFGEALDRFAILDFVPRQRIDDQQRQVFKQVYRLQSPSSGEHAIPPLLIEFVDQRTGQKAAPAGQDAYELLTERVGFTVQSVLPTDATADLHPPLNELPLHQISPSDRGLAVGLGGLAILSVAGLTVGYMWWKHRKQVRRESAYEIAARRLQQLLIRPLATEDAVELFFVELSSIVRQYLEDRFDMRAPELTTEEFLVSVSDSPDLSVAHQRLLREFLHYADLVKFARMVPGEEDIRQAIERARQFLDETRDDSLFSETEGDTAPQASLATMTRKGD